MCGGGYGGVGVSGFFVLWVSVDVSIIRSLVLSRHGWSLSHLFTKYNAYYMAFKKYLLNKKLRKRKKKEEREDKEIQITLRFSSTVYLET